MRAVLILNPHATSTTSRRRDLLTHALASDLRLAVAPTTRRGHAIELAAQAAASGADLVVVHGGDGTVNEAVNGLMQHGSSRHDRPMLAVVPGGSTNVFARALGIEADPTAATEQILHALAHGLPGRPISLGLADDRYFTFNAGLGMDAEVVQAVEDVRAKGKKITNFMHVRKSVGTVLRADRRHPRLKLTLPGEQPCDVHFVFVSNVDPWTYWEARPVRTNPGTGPETGLGVYALAKFGMPTVLTRVVPSLLSAGKVSPGGAVVRHDDLPELTVECENGVDGVGFQVDGDYLGLRSRVHFRSVENAVTVFGAHAVEDPSHPVSD